MIAWQEKYPPKEISAPPPLQEELSGKNGRPIPSEIQENFEDIENKLTKSIRRNLLNVEDKPIKSWGERFLNTIAKFFGFDGYKSQATIQTEERNINLSKLSQQLPDAIPNATLSAKSMNEFKESLKKTKIEEETLDNNNSCYAGV
ncbi:hypothetical protein [Legionella sainthelensi]|uniref:hypothetical protein n=1 Tax=Legionella sainthelensi TaxID=28087 RepID=UPI00135CDEC8|nr:hypothetical protein [Legionella sainthelensi]